MKRALVISIVMNILFVLFGAYVIHKKGGMGYLKRKLNLQTERTNYPDMSVYYNVKKSIFDIMPNDTNEIVFVGNSITEYCDWNELFGKSNIKNRGIAGDLITGVIARVDEIVESYPEKIFLMIGTNDLEQKSNKDQILGDYEKLVKLFLKQSPETELYLQSVLPTKNNSTRKNSDIVRINKGIRDIATKYSLTYINLFDLFATDENELNMDLSFDGLHLNGKGYLIWKDAISYYLEN